MRDLQFYINESRRAVPHLTPEEQLAWAKYVLETHPGFGKMPEISKAEPVPPEAGVLGAVRIEPRPVIEPPVTQAAPDPPPATASPERGFGFVNWWRIAVLILLLALCVIDARAQDPASQGIILGFQQSGTTLAQRGTGIARLNCSTNMTCTWNSTTSTFTLTSSGGGGGGSPCGSLGEVQLYATSSTLGCGNLFYDGSGYYIFGTSDFSGTSPDLGFSANQLEIDPNQSISARVLIKSFNAGGGFGSDINSIGASLLSHVDGVTKYFAAQVDFGAEANNSSGEAHPFTIGAEGHCATVNSCVLGTLTDYDFYLINNVTGHSLLISTNAAPDQLTVPAVATFATLGNYTATAQIVSNDTTDSNPFLLSKNAIADAAPGAGYVSFKAVAGTTAGTCKIVMKAGTSATPVTLIDNIGSGC